MKHIKVLHSKFKIIDRGDEFILLCEEQGDTLLSSIMDDLEEGIISFTNELEGKIADMYKSIEDKCTELFNSVTKMPSKSEVSQMEVFEAIEKVTLIKKESAEILATIFDYVDKSFDETFDNDIHFLRFSSLMARDLGDVQEAVKIQELTRKRLIQLADIISDICQNADEKITGQIYTILDLIDHKYDVLEFFNLNEDGTVKEDIEIEDTDYDTNKKDNIRIPRTNLELKRYLKKQGFELHRHNGSHQIYKNEEGEVRLIPSRRGNHVLAAKTAKKIYQGVPTNNVHLTQKEA